MAWTARSGFRTRGLSGAVWCKERGPHCDGATPLRAHTHTHTHAHTSAVGMRLERVAG
uniref:Uncharacterized protein n=1 Tax=Anguilla anguilla TaxID=7936 RepID=A0A0E9Y0Z1_ANGAN